MSTPSHEERLDLTADDRSLERKRWFEHRVMVPVSLGMVTAFIIYGARDLIAHFGGQSWPLTSLPGWALFVLNCAAALGALWLIRR